MLMISKVFTSSYSWLRRVASGSGVEIGAVANAASNVATDCLRIPRIPVYHANGTEHPTHYRTSAIPTDIERRAVRTTITFLF